jgi:hypothetical protein
LPTAEQGSESQDSSSSAGQAAVRFDGSVRHSRDCCRSPRTSVHPLKPTPLLRQRQNPSPNASRASPAALPLLTRPALPLDGHAAPRDVHFATTIVAGNCSLSVFTSASRPRDQKPRSARSVSLPVPTQGDFSEGWATFRQDAAQPNCFGTNGHNKCEFYSNSPVRRPHLGGYRLHEPAGEHDNCHEGEGRRPRYTGAERGSSPGRPTFDRIVRRTPRPEEQDSDRENVRTRPPRWRVGTRAESFSTNESAPLGAMPFGNSVS